MAEAGPYEEYFSPSELRRLRRTGGMRGVEAEVDAARMVVMRLMESGQAEERPEVLIRALEAVIHAMRVQHQIGGGATNSFVEAADRMLAEIGLGGEP